MYRRRIQFILERKLREVVELYAPDGSLVTTLAGGEPSIVTGHGALRKFFASRFNIVGTSGTHAYWTEVKNALMTTLRATFEFDDGTSITASLFDNWHLTGGRIALHSHVRVPARQTVSLQPRAATRRRPSRGAMLARGSRRTSRSSRSVDRTRAPGRS